MITMVDVERADEAQMLSGLGWREAASITNEVLFPVQAIATRCQEAEAIRNAPGSLCPHCEREADELVPWEGERVCWPCIERQLDLLVRATRQLPVTVGRGVLTPGHECKIDWDLAAAMASDRQGELDCQFAAGKITFAEHQRLSGEGA
jgi:hypothetical protein